MTSGSTRATPTRVVQPKTSPSVLAKEFPVAINGGAVSPLEAIAQLNALAGAHGVGRVDIIEDRLVGIKSREIYEVPAALTLINAHEELENLVLERDLGRYKRKLEADWANLIYDGLWFSDLKSSLDAFFDHTQKHVSGDVRCEPVRRPGHRDRSPV